jgi:fatty acid amide hydrolase
MLWELSAVDLARMLERKEISSEELVSALHARRDVANPKLNAFVADLREEGLDEARQRDAERARGEIRGPLHGMPVTIKDNIDVRGTDATLGTSARRGRPSRTDAVTVALLREAGAIIVGKTNVPQTLLSMECTNPVFGTTVNPWDVRRVPGGSSGGEGAAIASGMSVLGVGTDIGGSVRIPAAFCGLAGIKPTLHRWSNKGSNSAVPGQEIVRSQMGPLARSVRDLELLFRTLDAPLHARLDPEVSPLPIADSKNVELRGLRVGFYDDDQYFTPAASVQRAVREAARHLSERGCEIVPFDPPRANEHYRMMVGAVTGDGMETLKALVGDDAIIEALKMNWRVAKLPITARKVLGRTLRALGEVRASDAIAAMGPRSVREWFRLAAHRTAMQREEIAAWNEARIDAIVCPATATPPALLGKTGDFTPAASYTTRYNVLNFPAGVVPVTRVRESETHRTLLLDRVDKRAAQFEKDSTGLPLAVQIVGRPFREDVVIALMAAVEESARTSSEFPKTPIDPR